MPSTILLAVILSAAAAPLVTANVNSSSDTMESQSIKSVEQIYNVSEEYDDYDVLAAAPLVIDNVNSSLETMESQSIKSDELIYNVSEEYDDYDVFAATAASSPWSWYDVLAAAPLVTANVNSSSETTESQSMESDEQIYYVSEEYDDYDDRHNNISDEMEYQIIEIDDPG